MPNRRGNKIILIPIVGEKRKKTSRLFAESPWCVYLFPELKPNADKGQQKPQSRECSLADEHQLTVLYSIQ